MKKIIATDFLTLDGVMEDSQEWQPPYVSEDVAQEMTSHIHNTEGSLMGRVTYELLAAYWPLQKNNEFGIADKLNQEPKYVVSSKLDEVNWNNTTLIKGDVAEQIRQLKRQPGGGIRLVGSARLTQSLMEWGLVDEYHLLVHPLVRGHGKRLFNGGVDTMGLKLIEARPFSSGVVLLRYQASGSEK